MPAYKAEFIKESISSILSQDYNQFDLIILDDCSPDNINAIVNSFNDKRIKYYRNSHNIGGKDLVAQWNKAVSLSNSDWIILATDDDIYNSSFLSTADSLISKYPQVDIFRARLSAFNSNSNKIESFEPSLPEYISIAEYYHYLTSNLFGGIPQFVINRNALINIGGFAKFPLAWGSDDATSLRLSTNGIVCSSNILVYFRQSNINISSVPTYKYEKVVARFLKEEYIFRYILPIVNDKNIYELKGHFPFKAKEHLLYESYKLDYFSRILLIHFVFHNTPYLSFRNKCIMAIRLFITI